MAWTPPSKDSIPRAAAETLVAFESFTYRTPPTAPTSSSRCGTPAKRRSASATAAAGTPAASAAAEAPMAFSRLCGPRSRISPGGRGRSAGSPNEILLASPGSSSPGGATATWSGRWRANIRSLAWR